MSTRRWDGAVCWLCDYGLVLLALLLVLLVGLWRWGGGSVGAAPAPMPPANLSTSVPPAATVASLPTPAQITPVPSAETPAATAAPSAAAPSPTPASSKPEFVIVFVPVHWQSGQAAFEAAAQERGDLFVEASHLDLYFTPKIIALQSGLPEASLSSPELLYDLLEFGLQEAPGDRYVGLTDGDLSIDGDNRVAGWTAGDQGVLAEHFDPYIVAHELGHTFGLCDEYSYGEWSRENGDMTGGCPNPYPASCPRDAPTMVNCFGDPTDGGLVSIMGPAGSLDPHGFNTACLTHLESTFNTISGGKQP